MKGSSSTSSSRSVRLLSIKVVALLAPFAALSLPAVTQTLSVMAQAERSVALRGGVFDALLEGKLEALVSDDTEVIIGGDSRAAAQVVPALIEARTGRAAVNVATAAQDLITLSNALARHDIRGGGRVLIVSASFFQVNDSAIDGGFLSTACLLNMTTRERARVYLDRLGSPWSPLAFKFTEDPPREVPVEQLREKGFVGIDKQLSLPLPKVLLNAHPWYRKISLNGARWRIFQEALDRLAASGYRVYIVQPPVSPAWRAYTANTFVASAEMAYAAMLSSVARKHTNVSFLDFYSVPDPRLSNDKFADIQHLNRGGAELFTGILLDRIGDGIATARSGGR
jgi:hypothetical protein